MFNKQLLAALLAISLCGTANALTLCDQFCHGKFYVAPSLLVEQISANHSSFRGLPAQMALGHADWSNRYYIAAEVFYIPATLVLSDMRGNANASTAKSSNSFGISLLPGTLIYKKILGFLRIGLITSRFVAPNSMKLGAQLGAGLQTRLNNEFALRAEYTYTGYSSVSQIGTPHTNTLGFGFLYFFDT